jgi:hypothetical protein
MIDVSYALCIWKMCCNDIGRMDGQTADINSRAQSLSPFLRYHTGIDILSMDALLSEMPECVISV